jgi:hypothetical protein
MVKRKTGRHRRKRAIEITPVETSTQASSEMARTPPPDASPDESSSDLWGTVDRATGDSTDEEAEEPQPYAQTYSALIDKYVFSRRFLPFALAAIVVFCLILQDNGAGKLTNWHGIGWTLAKCGMALAIFVVVLVLQWLYQKIVR